MSKLFTNSLLNISSKATLYPLSLPAPFKYVSNLLASITFIPKSSEVFTTASFKSVNTNL